MNLSFDFDAPAASSNAPFPALFQTLKAVPRPERAYWPDYDKTAPKSPWGPVQHQTDYMNGCVEVSTSGHGGMKVVGALAKKIPALFRNRSSWYEEDCEVLIPLYYLYDDFKVIADSLTEEEARRCGFVAAVKNKTKEQCLASLLSHGFYAATFDFINKKTRPVESFKSEYDQREYAARLDALTNPVPPKTLEHGQVIRFAKPIFFTVDRKNVEVTDFIVLKEGRKVLFRPVGHTFTARISKWEEYEYSTIELKPVN